MRKVLNISFFVVFIAFSSCRLVGCGPEPTYDELKEAHQDGVDTVRGLLLGVVLVGGFILFVKSRQGKK